MNIKIYIEKNLLILKYYQFDHDWIKEKFDSVMEEDIEEEVVTIKKIFDFKKKDIINSKPDIYNEEEKYEYFFKLGEVINDEYIKIQAGIICHKEIRFYDYPNKFDVDWEADKMNYVIMDNLLYPRINKTKSLEIYKIQKVSKMENWQNCC